MTISEKAIAKADKAINEAIEKLEAEKKEAQADFWDTGYDRYYNKMHRCEDQLEHLREYVDSRSDVKRYRKRIANLESGISVYMKKLDELQIELRGDIPDNQLAYIIERCKTRLELALDEAERR